MQCSRCHDKPAAGSVIFNYHGCHVTIFKHDSFCKECAQAEWVRIFKEFSPGFITIDSGKVAVDWSHLTTQKTQSDSDLREKLYYLIFSLGVFSKEAKGN